MIYKCVSCRQRKKVGTCGGSGRPHCKKCCELRHNGLGKPWAAAARRGSSRRERGHFIMGSVMLVDRRQSAERRAGAVDGRKGR